MVRRKRAGRLTSLWGEDECFDDNVDPAFAQGMARVHQSVEVQVIEATEQCPDQGRSTEVK
jgi:hypothetical protein